MNEERTGVLTVQDTGEFTKVFTVVKTRSEFVKELEELYNKQVKKNYERKGFRIGEVPFKIAMENPEVSSMILELGARVNGQIMTEQIVDQVELSIYDIYDGENQTKFDGFELEAEEDVIFELVVELASYVEEVDYKNIKIDKEDIKSERLTEEQLEEVYFNYRKVKDQVPVVEANSFVDLKFSDGTEDSTFTFNLGETPEDDELKKSTHERLVENTLGKKVGDEFPFVLNGTDDNKIDVTVSIIDIYNVVALEDEEFLKMLNESLEVDQHVTIEQAREQFFNYAEENYLNSLEEEVRGLTFNALNELTTGIHYNQKEIDNLKNEFTGQVLKMAEQNGKTYDEYVQENFQSHDLMNAYIEQSQKLRVLQAAIYRKIGQEIEEAPDYQQLLAFVKAFVLRVDPKEKLEDAALMQLNAQAEVIIEAPLNRKRILDGWYTAKAEDVIAELVAEQIK